MRPRLSSRRVHHPQGWWPTEMNRSGTVSDTRIGVSCCVCTGGDIRTCRISGQCGGDAQPAWWRGAAVAGVRRSACADSAVSQAKPVTMLARWNSPPRLMSLGDWPKPAPARAMVSEHGHGGTGAVQTEAVLRRPARTVGHWPARRRAARRTPGLPQDCVPCRHRWGGWAHRAFRAGSR